VAEYRAALWGALAYVARYGHQPVSEMFRLTIPRFWRLHEALSDLVRQENASGDED